MRVRRTVLISAAALAVGAGAGVAVAASSGDQPKQHRAHDGRVLGMGPGGPHGPGDGRGPGFGHGGPGGPGMHGPFGPALDAAASALGTTRADLMTQLRAGKSIADVAKANGKSVDDVKAAIKAAVTKQLDADVTAKRITADQRQHILDELDQHLDDLVNRSAKDAGPRFGPRMRGAHPMHS